MHCAELRPRYLTEWSTSTQAPGTTSPGPPDDCHGPPTKGRTRDKKLENKGGGPGKLGRASPKEARGALPLWPPQLSEEGCQWTWAP